MLPHTKKLRKKEPAGSDVKLNANYIGLTERKNEFSCVNQYEVEYFGLTGKCNTLQSHRIGKGKRTI
jgi:hypothetical protein